MLLGLLFQRRHVYAISIGLFSDANTRDRQKHDFFSIYDPP